MTTTVFLDMPLLESLYYPEDGRLDYGGAEVQIKLLVESMVTRPDYHVVLRNENQLNIPGVECRTYRMISRGLPLVSRRLNVNRKREFFHTAGGGPGVLLLTLPPSRDIVEAAKQCGIKTVFRINGDSLIDEGPLNKQAPVLALREMLPIFDLVVCQSPTQQQLLREGWGLNAPLVRNATYDYGCLPASQRKYVLWVGRPAPLKRPWLFIEAAKRFPQTLFKMIIPRASDDSLGEVLDAEAQRLPNLDVIRGLPYASMSQQYQNAIAFVSTSLSEGAPSVFAEAAMAGTPVLSLSVGEGPLFAPGTGGYFADHDLDLLCQELGELIKEPEHWQAQSTRIRRFAQVEWDANRAFQSYEEVFSSVIKDDPK